MYTFLIVVHVLVCFALVIVVLLQQGQSSDLSGIFGGGGGGGPILSGRSAMSMMNKITVGAFIIFLFTSITISIYQSKKYQHEKTLQNIEEKIPIKPQEEKPELPGAQKKQPTPKKQQVPNPHSEKSQPPNQSSRQPTKPAKPDQQ